VAGFSEFEPHNVFTPNNDNYNDYYELDNLPPDNCFNQFLGINIFNRWGKLVFTDNNRDFRWDGQGMAAGVYYYVIKYTNKEFKGSVSIIY
jgi:gliding motility-associated-like protein